ncbi:MAG TPA: hypothetical protein VNW68_00060, partial [Candidatus Limnocylindria bacterium]|nr:hypothetical protein [Candidatus Limnocylindria bacterium]
MSIVAARQRIRSYIAGWRSPGGWSLSPAAALGLLLAGGLLLRLLIAFVLFPQAGLYNDLRFFTDWSVVLAEHGPGGFYANVAWSDYPPGYLWVLWLFGSLGRGVALLTGGSVAGTIEYWIKLPAILADLAVAVIFYGAIRRWQGHRPALLVAGGWLFTPVSWYDSALWGQVDVFGVLLMGLAVIWLIDRRPELASAAAVAAFLVKPQFAIVVGVVGIVLLRRHLLARRGAAGDSVIERRWPERLYAHRFEEGPLRLVLAAVAGLAVLLAGTLPFDLERFADPALAGVPVVGDLAGLAGLIGSAAGFYNVLTANAFNPWALVGPTPLVTSLTGDYVWTFDSLPILGVPASAWGAGLFLAVTAGVTLLLLRRDDRLAILVGITVLAVAFFVLPTRVHERYLFGAVGLGALLLATSIGWRIWFIAISAVGLVNMHAILTLPFRGYGTF